MISVRMKKLNPKDKDFPQFEHTPNELRPGQWLFQVSVFPLSPLLGSSSISPAIARAVLLSNPRQPLIETVFLKIIQAKALPHWDNPNARE